MFFFFFSQGIHFKRVKGTWAFSPTPAPDVGAQGQPVRQGYCFLSSAMRLSSAANQTLRNTSAISELPKPDRRKTSEQYGCYRWYKTRRRAGIGSGYSVQHGQAFRQVLRDRGRPTGLPEQTLTQNVVSIAVHQIWDSVTQKKRTEPHITIFIAFQSGQML